MMPTTYWNNESQFAADLTEAAEYGNATGDWTRYTAIQRQLAAETAVAVLNQAQAAEKARQDAITEAEARMPGFGNLIREHRDTLRKERPDLEEAISWAERDPRLKKELGQLFDCAGDYFQTTIGPGSRTQTTEHARSEQRTTSDTSRDLSTSASRQRIIQEFEARHPQDVPIDAADTSENVFRY